MPPKASTLETPRGVGKPQLPPSGDAALDLKRQKNREAAARSRAKAKAATAAASGAASGVATPAVNPFVINQKKTMDTMMKKMKVVAETRAKETLTTAIKNKKARMEARKEMTGLNLNKAVMISKMVEIKINFSKIKRYARDYPKVVEYLESKGEKEGKEIKLKYRPLGRFDYFLYDYDNNEPTKGYYFKVSRYIDENFSASLRENFYSKVYEGVAITDTSRGTGDEKYADYPVGDISTASFRSDTSSLSKGAHTFYLDDYERTSISTDNSMINKKNFPKDAIRIELPYEEFRKYIQQYPKIIKFIEKELQKEHSYTYDPKRKTTQEIYLKYRPYKNYDYFSFAYYPKANPDPSYSGKASYLRFKINNEVEIEYSTHLWDEYWDYEGRYSKNRNATSITTGSTKSERSANSSAISTYSGIMANLERKRA